MTTMMEHPKHGRHPAIGSEIEHMKANGWTICPPKVKAEAHQDDGHMQSIVLPLEGALAPVVKRAYNRKPKA